MKKKPTVNRRAVLFERQKNAVEARELTKTLLWAKRVLERNFKLGLQV